jgi:hypothetical protein
MAAMATMQRVPALVPDCQTLFGIAKIPSDNYIRDMLDLADPALLRSTCSPSRPCARPSAGWAAEP